MSVKVAICVPMYGLAPGKFIQSLANMLTHFMSANIIDKDGNPIGREVDTFIVSSSMLTQSRHMLVAEALKWGANYMLWLDADHVFPPDTLARLWAQNLPVVGCNYARRCIPTAPTAASSEEAGGLIYTTAEKAAAGEVEKVSHLGFGVCLMDMRIFDVLEYHAEQKGEKSFLPLFAFETTRDGLSVRGEDVFFFNKLRDAGIDIWCDHGLSWEVGHIHETIMTNEHAVKQKEKWEAKRVKDSTRYVVEEQSAA